MPLVHKKHSFICCFDRRLRRCAQPALFAEESHLVLMAARWASLGNVRILSKNVQRKSVNLQKNVLASAHRIAERFVDEG